MTRPLTIPMPPVKPPRSPEARLAALTAIIDRLHALLHDPHPGLSTWQTAVAMELEELARYCPRREVQVSVGPSSTASFRADHS